MAEAFAGVHGCGNDICGRGQRALPLAVVPAGRVVQEVQVNDQGAGRAAEVSALGGIEDVAASAVAGLAGGAVTQRQEQPAGILLQPPHADGHAQRQGKLDVAEEAQRSTLISAGMC